MDEMKGRFLDTSGHISIEWTLEKSVALPSCKSSPKYDFAGAIWYFELRTCTIKSEKWLTIWLLKDKSRSEQHFVNYALGVKNLSGKIYEAYSRERLLENEKEAWEKEILISHSNLSDDGISFKEKVIICCNAYCPKLKMKEAESQTLSDDDLYVLAEDFANLFLKEQNSDVNILVGKRKFRIHKSVIAARSPVFAAMFEQEMQEKQTGIVTITDCDPDAFHDFLYYLYSGKADKISKWNVVSLYSIAHKYDVNLLIRRCLQFIMDNFSVELFCNFLSLAIKYSESNLLKVSVEFFSENAEKIVITKEWQSFMKENYTLANELFIKALANLRVRKTKT